MSASANRSKPSVVKRWAKRALLTGFALFLPLLTILQTPWAKNQIRERLVDWANQQGIQLKIESIQGRLPIEWRLCGVSLQKEGIPPIAFEEVNLRLRLRSLLIGKIDCPHLSGIGGQLMGIPFEARAQFTPEEISYLSIEGQGFAFSGKAALSLDSLLMQWNCTDLSQISNLFPVYFQGSCTGELELKGAHLQAHLKAAALTIAGIDFSPTSLELHAEPCSDGWQGALKAEGGPKEIPLSLELVFNSPKETPLIQIEEILLKGPETKIHGALQCTPTLSKLAGTLSLHCSDLKNWRPLFPTSQLAGSVEIQAALSQKILTASLEAEQLSLLGSSWKKIHVEGEFEKELGCIKLNAQQGAYQDLLLAHVQTTAFIRGSASDFKLEAEGTLKTPFTLSTAGRVSLQSQRSFLQLSSLDGYACNHPISLKDPLAMEWSDSHFKLRPLRLQLGEGLLSGRMDLNEETSLIKLEATECPLDFLSLVFPLIDVNGEGSAKIDLVGWNGGLQGSCHLLVDHAEITPFGRPTPLKTKGSIQLHFDRQRAQMHGLLRWQEDQTIDLSGSFPLQYSSFPFSLKLDGQRPFAAELAAECDLEDLLQFINIGPQRLEGRLSTRLLLREKGISGEIELQNGLYENYVSGSLLKGVSAKGIAHERGFTVHTITATDESEEGKMTGRGELSFRPQFSFVLESDLQNFQVIADRIVVGRVSGPLTIRGDRNGSGAVGSLKIEEAHLRIPDQLPQEYPHLPVTFIRPPDRSVEGRRLRPRLPFNLDLDLTAPKHIFFEGRGLTCELKGNLHLSGTYTSMAARGEMALLKGEYLFCGKMFTLNHADLVFVDKPSSSASIALTGSCDLPDVTATVSIRGPLSSPTLSLQSIPQLPTSALLARLLFNKDVSEISPIQALQLAQTLLSITGSSGPSDLFEKVRKTLHIDRLTLLTSENDPGKISLQVGKYVMRNVLLTLIQGATSRNVAVEVELMRGFTLQAEMNEKQQGKFSLKWHHHY